MGMNLPLVYPDTNVLVYLIENRLALSSSVRAQMYPAHDPMPVLVFSELTRMECLVQPMRSGDDVVLTAYEKLFGNAAYRMAGFTRQTFELATQLRVQHRLKTPDALHLAAAITSGCNEFWTNDHRLAQAAQGHLQLVTFGSNP